MLNQRRKIAIQRNNIVCNVIVFIYLTLFHYPPFLQNLKKSWHPQTMKNIERVWKAEQKHEAEQKKIDELQKELKDERAREEITRFAQETGAIKSVLIMFKSLVLRAMLFLHYSLFCFKEKR